MDLLIIQHLTLGYSNLEALSLCTVALSMCDDPIFHLKGAVCKIVAKSGMAITFKLL